MATATAAGGVSRASRGDDSRAHGVTRRTVAAQWGTVGDDARWRAAIGRGPATATRAAGEFACERELRPRVAGWGRNAGMPGTTSTLIKLAERRASRLARMARCIMHRSCARYMLHAVEFGSGMLRPGAARYAYSTPSPAAACVTVRTHIVILISVSNLVLF